MKAMVTAALAAAGLMAMAGGAAAQEMPHLVAAYARQLAEQCGPLLPGVSAPPIADRVDLNGDGRDDWVVDAGRYPCPGRPAVAKAAGDQVTVFMGAESGAAVPVLQKATFGSRLQRPEGQPPVLTLILGGSDCGVDDTEARCDRRVVWRKAEERFELVAAKPAPASP